MKLFLSLVLAAACVSSAAPSLAGSAEENYRRKCSSCHDAGSAGAPKIGDKSQWARRNRNGTSALYASAIRGVANTAMIPKGGFTELSDEEIKEIVDYLLAQAGQKYRETSTQPPARADKAPQPGARAEQVDDATLVARIKVALARTKGISANDVKLEAAAGVVTLKGVVDNAQQIKIAENVALKTKGVQRVDNKLIPKDLFAWD